MSTKADSENTWERIQNQVFANQTEILHMSDTLKVYTMFCAFNRGLQGAVAAVAIL